MPLKWRLFGIVNYIILVFFLFVLAFAMKAFFNPRSGMRYLEGAKLITACIFMIVINNSLNIYIFHRHLPANPLNKGFKRLYTIASILCCIGLVIIIYYFILDSIDLLTHNSDLFFVFTIAFMLLLTMVVLVAQYTLTKFIEKEFKNKLAGQLDDIGKEENNEQL